MRLNVTFLYLKMAWPVEMLTRRLGKASNVVIVPWGKNSNTVFIAVLSGWPGILCSLPGTLTGAEGLV